MAEGNDFFTGYLSGKSENGNGGMFGGGGWEGIIGLVVILALLGGGLGFGGGLFGGGLFGGGGSGFQGMATRADINAGFQFNDLQNGIRGLERGLCDGFYGVQNGFNNLSAQLAQCCCDNRAAISDLKFTAAQEACATRNLMQTNTRDIIDSQNAGTRAILDFMVQEKLSSKDARIAQLENQIALSNQTAVYRADLDATRAELLRRLGAECPTPAYLVQPPTPVNFPVNGCGTVQFGCNGGYNGSCGNGYAYAA